MRRLLVLLCCISLLAADVARKQFFELREALQRRDTSNPDTLLDRALTDSRFGHEATAIQDLRKLLAAHANPGREREIYEELAAALVRLGRYGESSSAWADVLRVAPHDGDRAGNENTRALYEALRDVPPQTIEFGEELPIEAKHNGLGSWNVPVEVNGHQGEWIFDTGANLSTLSESEATRLGLSLRETSTYVAGSTNKKNPLRLAVARDLHFGNAQLSNVVFLVISDQALYIQPLKYQIHGILGLPVLRALGQVGISATGKVRIESKETVTQGQPNLFFDELTPIVDVRHGEHRLQMFLDTGANATAAYPSFRAALTKDQLGKLKSKREKTGGAGGTVSRKTDVIPTLQLEILGRTVSLTGVSLLSKQLPGPASYRDGVIGMDCLAGGFTLDFRAMQLRLD